MDWRLLVKEGIANIAKKTFFFWNIAKSFSFHFLGSSDLCKPDYCATVGTLAGAGSVAVTVGVSDR